MAFNIPSNPIVNPAEGLAASAPSPAIMGAAAAGPYNVAGAVLGGAMDIAAKMKEESKKDDVLKAATYAANASDKGKDLVNYVSAQEVITDDDGGTHSPHAPIDPNNWQRGTWGGWLYDREYKKWTDEATSVMSGRDKRLFSGILEKEKYANREVLSETLDNRRAGARKQEAKVHTRTKSTLGDFQGAVGDVRMFQEIGIFTEAEADAEISKYAEESVQISTVKFIAQNPTPQDSAAQIANLNLEQAKNPYNVAPGIYEKARKDIHDYVFDRPAWIAQNDFEVSAAARHEMSLAYAAGQLTVGLVAATPGLSDDDRDAYTAKARSAAEKVLTDPGSERTLVGLVEGLRTLKRSELKATVDDWQSFNAAERLVGTTALRLMKEGKLNPDDVDRYTKLAREASDERYNSREYIQAVQTVTGVITGTGSDTITAAIQSITVGQADKDSLMRFRSDLDNWVSENPDKDPRQWAQMMLPTYLTVGSTSAIVKRTVPPDTVVDMTGVKTPVYTDDGDVNVSALTIWLHEQEKKQPPNSEIATMYHREVLMTINQAVSWHRQFMFGAREEKKSPAGTSPTFPRTGP